MDEFKSGNKFAGLFDRALSGGDMRMNLPPTDGVDPAFVKFITHHLKKAIVAKDKHEARYENPGATCVEAKWVLGFSRGNRTMRPSKLASMRDSYMRKQFPALIPIHITIDGILANGHHRLTSLSQCPPTVFAPILFSFGMTEEEIRYLDKDQTQRDDRDRRHFEAKTAISKKQQAIARGYLELSRFGSARIHHFDAETFDLAVDVDLADQFSRLPFKSQFPAGFWAAVFWVYPACPDAIAEFSEAVLSGANHAEGAPACLMRESMLQLQKGGHAGSKSNLLLQARALYLLRAHCQGRALKKVYVPEFKEAHAWWKERLIATSKARKNEVKP